MIDELTTIATTPELGAMRTVATHPLVRLCFPTIAECWKYAEYHHVIQDKSETLLSLRDTIERWRCTPYDVLFEEMRNA